MKIKLLFILLYSTFLFGQKPVEIKIDSLTSYDKTQEERTFTIKFSITNKTNKILSLLSHCLLTLGHIGKREI